MQRTPEPELMEDAAQVKAYAAADFSAGDGAVVERLAALASAAGINLDTTPGALLVDLGCGPGNISLRLVERFTTARVVGIDGSAAMLQVAEQRRGRLSPAAAARLSFLQEILPSPALAAAPLARHCQAVVSNSLLHHLHDPAVLWQAVAQLGAPGALVSIQDLRRPASPEAVEALVVSQTQGAPELLRHDYRASLNAAFTVAEVQEQLKCAVLAHACLTGLQVAPRQERYLEVSGRLG
jgi:trans-aconitate 2-methyltransferase